MKKKFQTRLQAAKFINSKFTNNASPLDNDLSTKVINGVVRHLHSGKIVDFFVKTAPTQFIYEEDVTDMFMIIDAISGDLLAEVGFKEI